MKPYFDTMDRFGKALKPGRVKRAATSVDALRAVEAGIGDAVAAVEDAGFPTETINTRGWMTVYQRLEYLVDAGAWHPLHTLYNPLENEEGTTNVVDGLGQIEGRWAVVIGFDNKVMAGAWLPGQAENILRATDLAARLNIPLVWLVNCSGAKLPEQEKFYATRRGAGTPFFRHAELEQAGIPVLAGIYGTNPAGGGYQSISPTVLLAHKDANMAVGGVGIVSGMAPKGGFDTAMVEELIAKTREFTARPPGDVATHHDATGFFTRVYEEETGVLDGLKEYMRVMQPTGRSSFGRPSRRRPRSRSTICITCCRRTRRRSTTSTRCWPVWLMAASGWSSDRTTVLRSSPASARSTVAWWVASATGRGIWGRAIPSTPTIRVWAASSIGKASSR